MTCDPTVETCDILEYPSDWPNQVTAAFVFPALSMVMTFYPFITYFALNAPYGLAATDGAFTKIAGLVTFLVNLVIYAAPTAMFAFTMMPEYFGTDVVDVYMGWAHAGLLWTGSIAQVGLFALQLTAGIIQLSDYAAAGPLIWACIYGAIALGVQLSYGFLYNSLSYFYTGTVIAASSAEMPMGPTPDASIANIINNAITEANKPAEPTPAPADEAVVADA